MNIPTSLRYAAISAAYLLLPACQSGDGDANRTDLATVIRGPLTISVTESATLRAVRETRITSKMEGKSTIIYLIPEGTQAKKGDKLVELDASQQVNNRASQEITVERSKAALISAQKSLEILRKQVQSETEAAENNLYFSRMDLEKFLGKPLDDGSREMGEREQGLKAEEAEIALAESRLKLAEDRLEWSRKLIQQDFITKTELEKDELDYAARETELKLAQNRLKILKDFTHQKQEAELIQGLKDAGLELERVIANGEAQIAQSEAELKSTEAELKLATERLENLVTQIKNAVIYAPAPGVVVYATEGSGWRREAIELGKDVRERQNLIILPDTSQMKAELDVQEAMVEKVQIGLPATLAVSTSDTIYTGRVHRVSALPDSGSRMSNPDRKVYKTVVLLDRSSDELRPNMSADVTITVFEHQNVLSIPLLALQRQGEVFYAWVMTPSGAQARALEIGDSNLTKVIVTKGLEEGDRVFLIPPPELQTPVFKQPEKPKPDPIKAVDNKATVSSAEANSTGNPAQRRDRSNAGGGGQQRGGGGGMSNSGYADFMAKLEEKQPDLHAKIQGGDWQVMRSQEFKDAVAADPELDDLHKKMRAAFSGMRGGSRPGQEAREQ